jgi:hypothetical protein
MAEESRHRSLDGFAIARAEMARRRKRLGTLTSDQEVAIEELLLSIARRISELVEGIKAEGVQIAR